MNNEREIEKLRDASHEHANRLTDHTARISMMEDFHGECSEKLQKHEVALARGQKTMQQIENTTEKLGEAADTMRDLVIRMDHSLSLFTKFNALVIFPIIVSVSGTAIWALLRHSTP